MEPSRTPSETKRAGRAVALGAVLGLALAILAPASGDGAAAARGKRPRHIGRAEQS